MRPEALNSLFVEVDALEGVGPKLRRPLEKLGLTRIRDLAYHLPDRFVERRAVENLDEAGVGENIIVALTVREYRTSSGRGPFRVLASDRLGNICALTYFGRASYTARKVLPVGETRWIAGRLDQYGQMLQIVHPEHVSESGSALQGQLCEAVYSLSEGLTQGRVSSLVHQALKALPEMPEWIEPGLVERMKWPAWREALIEAHKGNHSAARDRLAYDELLANALALMLVRESNRSQRGTPLSGDGSLREKLRLPFALTGAQKRSIAEIEGDMAQKSPPSGAPTRAAAASIAVMPGSTRMSRPRHVGSPFSTASNTAAAMAKTPGSPPDTTATRAPCAARSSAKRARSSSTRLSEACRRRPGRSGTRST